MKPARTPTQKSQDDLIAGALRANLLKLDAERFKVRLAETRSELAQLNGPNAEAFAKRICVSHCLTSYKATMEAQERFLVRQLENLKAKGAA